MPSPSANDTGNLELSDAAQDDREAPSSCSHAVGSLQEWMTLQVGLAIGRGRRQGCGCRSASQGGSVCL